MVGLWLAAEVNGDGTVVAFGIGAEDWCRRERERQRKLAARARARRQWRGATADGGNTYRFVFRKRIGWRLRRMPQPWWMVHLQTTTQERDCGDRREIGRYRHGAMKPRPATARHTFFLSFGAVEEGADRRR